MKAPSSSLFSAVAACLALSLVFTTADAQQGRGRGGGFGIDPRAQDLTYHFADTDVDLPYCVYVSSKVDPDEPAPLIITLHGLGAGPQIMCNTTAVDLAEEGGYILASPMGYNTSGWYGSLGPGVFQGRGGRGRGGAADAPPPPENLGELSEKDVMNVLAMMREQHNVDEDRIYLTGHSMGGAGTYFLGAKHADIWAAIAPVAPAAFSLTENRAQTIQALKDGGVAVMVVHGDMDEAVPVDQSRTWVASMEELGLEHEYVEMPGVTHGPVITQSQQYIYEFFDKHSK